MTELKGENASCLLISLDNNRQNFEREIEPEIAAMVRKYMFSKVAKIVIKCSYTKVIQIYRIIYKSIFAKKTVNFGYYDDYLAILSFIDRDCSTVFPSCQLSR